MSNLEKRRAFLDDDNSHITIYLIKNNILVVARNNLE